MLEECPNSVQNGMSSVSVHFMCISALDFNIVCKCTWCPDGGFRINPGTTNIQSRFSWLLIY